MSLPIRTIRVLAAASLLAAVAAMPHPAQAHASLVKCAGIPSGAKLVASPKAITCTFAEGLNPNGSFIKVVEASGDGAEDDKGDSVVSFSSAKQMTVGLPKLGKGAYYLMWFTVSADDGHRAGGVLPFSIVR